VVDVYVLVGPAGIGYAHSRIHVQVGNSDALLGRTLVLVAHPDDESAGCGGLLQRIAEPIVAIATDGAPRDEFFWGKAGSRLGYVRLRERELYHALALAGVSEIALLAHNAGAQESFVDQELYRAIPEAIEELAAVVRRYRPDALLTTAYEGGHPDHDVCSFLAAVLGKQYALPVWEFPLYHRRQLGDMAFQRFLFASGREEDETVLEIRPEEMRIKRQMLAAYGSQHPFLGQFDPAREHFRPQHAYDYSHPPHPGHLNYEAWQWPVTGEEVCGAFARFLQERQARVA
jgi:LmbE family N-acetylglucosaminyl deacetylase